jgi:iron-sulfur cluster insertion protein
MLEMNDHSHKMIPFTITDRAVEQIAKIIANESKSDDGSQHHEHLVFRLAVLGGGCSGFQYHFSIDQKLNDDDIVLHHNTASGVEVTTAIDTMSLEFVTGGQLDFLNELAGQYFQVNNPNASAGCGCGTSFAI